jgi:hypothetical protein
VCNVEDLSILQYVAVTLKGLVPTLNVSDSAIGASGDMSDRLWGVVAVN